ncbi:methionyl-tRNA formyltransferase [Bacteroidales bacterium OttesenSCG-928-A17]|nr:methionyl-tRNA formyltransferase [Bacteroidales bacterium OttesenSCG-928-A17]
MNQFPRIIFMGTPEFAVASLKSLVEKQYNVVAVITMPDKPKGKHHSILQASPVKEYALSQNIPVLQPENLKAPDFIDELRSLNADLQIVVAFRMLPEIVWNMPPLGTFNLHASLLPQYRGAAPINWAIINGEKKTGVTTFFLDKEIDTGKIIDRIEVPITDTDNAGTLHDELMDAGAGLVVHTVKEIIEKRIELIPQDSLFQSTEELKSAPKIFKETCEINWNQPTQKVYDFIRGLSPYPAAWSDFSLSSGTLSLKIFEGEKVIQTHNHQPGVIVNENNKSLNVSTQDGFIRLKTIQPAGKKRMNAEDFLRGNAHLFF